MKRLHLPKYNKVKHFKILIFLLIVSLNGITQESVNRSEIIETIGNRQYYIHLVRPGQTLQGIASAYGVDGNEINDENPQFQGRYASGDVIKIPKHSAQQAPKSTEKVPPALTSKTAGKTHLVEAGDTFFSVARRYNLSMPELMNANSGVEALYPGMVLLIPEPKAESVNKETASGIESDIIPETHLVVAGETLFSISRKFNISMDELIALNPDLKDGLKAGQTLNLRRVEPNPGLQYQIVQDTSVTYNYHRVRRRETLFGISREYGITVEQLLKHNPHVADGLQPRQILKIPVYQISEHKVIDEITPIEPLTPEPDLIPEIVSPLCQPVIDPYRTFKVALLLPFFLDSDQPVIHADTGFIDLQPAFNKSFEFMQFYLGAMLAIDSLKNRGLNATVYVFDVDNTPESVQRVLNRPELAGMDMIIGPFYANTFDRVARFARDNKIIIVNPLSPRSEFLRANPFTFKAQPSNKNQAKLIASFIRNNYNNANIIVVRQYSFAENEALDEIKQTLSGIPVREVNYIRDSIGGVIRNLDRNRENLVIGLANDKVFTIDLVRKLNDIRQDFNIACFGMEHWADFNLDTDHMVNLRLHLPASEFIDYNSEAVRAFLLSFRQKYGTEPLPHRFAFAAYDITWFFLSSLMYFGNNFMECVPSFHYRGLQYYFDFEPGERNGSENMGMIIYSVEDYIPRVVYPINR